MSQTIAEELDAAGDSLAAQLPDEINAVFAAEQSGLDARELPAQVVSTGDTLSDFALPDQTGAVRTLSDLTSTGPAVIVFYRGGWCPFCNVALSGYQRDLLPRLREAGAELVAISAERPDASLTTQEKNELDFALLTDSGLSFARSLGIVFQPEEAPLAAQRTVGFDIRDWRDDGATELPYPAVLVVDSDRVVRFVDIQTNYVNRTSVDAILEAVAVGVSD